MLMRITPYQINYRTNNNTKFYSANPVKNGSVSFTASFCAEVLAKRFRFVKDYRTQMEKAIYEDFGYHDSKLLQEASELVEAFRSGEANKDGIIKNTKNAIDGLQRKINEIRTKNDALDNAIKAADNLSAIEKIRLSRITASEKRKAGITGLLNEKYVGLHKLKEKTYPNGMVIMGLQNEDEVNYALKYLEEKDNKMLKINFDNIPLQSANTEMLKLFKRIASEGKHALLYIENFAKYTVPTEENYNFINKLKHPFQSCAGDYNTTVLIFENNPDRLDAAIAGQHRLKRLDVSDIKTEITSCFVPKFDGYTMVYDTGEHDAVDLYLGDFGTNRNVLWVDSDWNAPIRAAINHFQDIRKIDKFKDVKLLYFRRPDNMEGIKDTFEVSNVTEDYKPIIGVFGNY